MSIRSFLKSAFSILLLAFLPGMVQAQISVSPTILEEKAYPGGVVKLRLGLANTSDEPLYCTISVSAMEVQGDGLPVAVPDAPRSCHTWISFGETDFALAPKQGKSLLGSVRVPRDASGGYYAVIACHGKPPQGIENGGTEGVKAGIRFSYRVMAVVLL
ncbi:hypothetical protein HQ520_09655, partial [bacterium]|nr:hypothetical protein [bacterium]